MKKFIFVFFLSLCSWQADAKMDYSVTIPVDVDAENSVVAKDKAMIDAQRQAFLQISSGLVSQDDMQKLEELTDDEIVHFIESVAVADEKSGGTKYRANLTVQINEKLLKDYLSENEMIQSEVSDITVVPLFKPLSNRYILLWEDNNLWHQNWLSKGLIKFGTMQIKPIRDNFRNIVDFDAENSLYMGNDLYQQIAEVGGTKSVYVVYAEELQNGDLKVTVKNEKSKAEDNFTVYNDGNSDIFDKAVEKSVMFISNMEREDKNEAQNVSFGNINAVYVYHDMRDWLNKSRLLETLPQVEGVDTKSFGGGKVNFSIRYTGSLESLWEELQNIGLTYEAVDNYYIIR